MKFILIIWVCSFVTGTSKCFPPMEFHKAYNSWYECSRDAHQQSIKLLSNMGFKKVNDAKFGTKYHCQEVHIY